MSLRDSRSNPSGTMALADGSNRGAQSLSTSLKARQKYVEVDVRELLMNEAERLFADRGYFGTSIRDITQAAGQRLAAVNYHFDSKEELFKRVILRRAAEINTEREALMANLPRPESDLEEYVRLLVEAYIGPLIRRAATGGEGWSNYARLLGSIAGTRIWTIEIVDQHFDPCARIFLGKARAAFPDCEDFDLHSMFQFMWGEMNYVITQNGRLDSLSQGRYLSSDMLRIYDRAVPFIVAGFLRLGQHDEQ